jgi:hypothetical protein
MRGWLDAGNGTFGVPNRFLPLIRAPKSFRLVVSGLMRLPGQHFLMSFFRCCVQTQLATRLKETEVKSAEDAGVSTRNKWGEEL